MTRRFEFVGGNSAKFWEVDCQAKEVTVRHGRLGTGGQSQTKSFATPDAAQRHAEKLIHQKQAKGYVECGPLERRRSFAIRPSQPAETISR